MKAIQFVPQYETGADINEQIRRPADGQARDPGVRRRLHEGGKEIRRVGHAVPRSRLGRALARPNASHPVRWTLGLVKNSTQPTIYRRACVITLSVTGVPACTASSPRRNAGTRSAGASTFSPLPPQVSITFS